VSGTFNYTVTITDSKGSKGTLNCSITVAPPVTTACVSFDAIQGTAITPVSLTGSGGAGGSYTFTATGLPAGLTMSSSGVISGTPTVSGTFTYTVTIHDAGGSQSSSRCSHNGTLTCTITVLPLVSGTGKCADGHRGHAITPVAVNGCGGKGGSYTFTSSNLPPGLCISKDGVISGTPTKCGSYSYNVTVTDCAGHTGTVICTSNVQS
jgi:hypothetical protein